MRIGISKLGKIGLVAGTLSVAPIASVVPITTQATEAGAGVVCNGQCGGIVTDLGPALNQNQQMHANQYLESPSGRYTLSMQSDGNLVEYDHSTSPPLALWDPPPYALDMAGDGQTAGHPNAYAELQNDGNFVVKSSSGSPLWASYTQQQGDFVRLQDDGNLVIYSGSTPLWATMTNIPAPQGSVRTSNLFPYGQCTYWAENEADVYAYVYPDLWGNALALPGYASSHGWNVGTTPRIGSLIELDPRVNGAGAKTGHIGFVTQFYPVSNRVIYTQMNVPEGNANVTQGVVTNGPGIHYIYLNP